MFARKCIERVSLAGIRSIGGRRSAGTGTVQGAARIAGEGSCQCGASKSERRSVSRDSFHGRKVVVRGAVLTQSVVYNRR